MATIRNTLALQDNMSKTLSSITKAMSSTLMVMDKIKSNKLGPEFQQAANDIKNAENQIKNFNKTLNNTNTKLSKTGKSSGSFFKSILGASAVQKVLGMVINSLDNAITRYDTLNNYPKVMSNLGISEEQANASRKRLSEGLEGLPTTLDSAVSAVQRFTSANKSIGGSTEMFLALNNALLAGGSSAETQASALEQISQSYAKGKPDMMEWKSLQNAMPAQLDQIAKAMNTTTTKLGEDLRAGKVSMNDFMSTIIKLNKEGINGFQSFEQQAKNSTNGIGTSMANLKTGFVKGVTEMITNINSGLGDLGLGGIPDIINNTSKVVKTTLGGIGTAMGNLLRMLKPILNTISQIYNFFKNNWTTIAPILIGITTAVIAFKLAMIGSSVVMGIIAGVEKAYTNVTKLATDATYRHAIAHKALQLACFAVIAIIVAVIAVLIYLWNTNDEVAYKLIYAWDSFQIAVQTACFGAQSAFYGVLDAIGVMKVVGLAIIDTFINAVVSKINSLINTINSITGLGISTIDYTSSLAEDAANDELKKKIERDNKLNEKATSIWNQAVDLNATREDRVKNRKKITNIFQNTTDNAIADSVANLDTGLGELTGSDGTGGKALKTTSNDDLLSDDDIKLLLDVATRDYKLNYQQITPNISVTFGDVRETVDVDDVMNTVGARIEELVYGDAEVPNG